MASIWYDHVSRTLRLVISILSITLGVAKSRPGQDPRSRQGKKYESHTTSIGREAACRAAEAQVQSTSEDGGIRY